MRPSNNLMFSDKISIIIPTYNSARYLTGAIESALLQDYPKKELIIIDDGSTDNTREIVKEFLNRPNVYYIHQENSGTGRARNAGIKKSTGKFIAFLDADDIWPDEEKIKKQANYLKTHPDIGLVGNNYIIIDEKEKELGRIRFKLSDKDIRNIILQSNHLNISSVMVRKKVLLAAGLFREEKKYSGAADYDFFLRVGKISKFGNIDEFLTKYRINTKGLTSSDGFRQDWYAFLVMLKYRELYPNSNKAILVRSMALLLPIRLRFFLKNSARFRNYYYKFIK